MCLLASNTSHPRPPLSPPLREGWIRVTLLGIDPYQPEDSSPVLPGPPPPPPSSPDLYLAAQTLSLSLSVSTKLLLLPEHFPPHSSLPFAPTLSFRLHFEVSLLSRFAPDGIFFFFFCMRRPYGEEPIESGLLNSFELFFVFFSNHLFHLTPGGWLLAALAPPPSYWMEPAGGEVESPPINSRC